MRGIPPDLAVARVGGDALAQAAALLAVEHRLAVPGKGVAGRILHLRVPVVVIPGQQPGILPGPEPVGHGGVMGAAAVGAVDGFHQVHAGQRAHGGCRGIQDGNEQ